MLKLTPEDVAKFHENIAKWLRNKEAAAHYAEFPFLHTGISPLLRHRTFFPYTRQPVDEPQYGLEIELDFEFTDLMVVPEIRRGLIGGMKQCLWEAGVLKHGISFELDDSVKDGVEVVLPPMPVSMLRNVLRKLYNVHGMQFTKLHEACGIHITTDPLPDEQSAVAFWNFWQNPDLYNGKYQDIADIIGRRLTKHCEIKGEVDNLKQIRQICKKQNRGAVVLRSNNCMEVRVFASVIDAKKVFRQVQFVDTVYRLCAKAESPRPVQKGLRQIIKSAYSLNCSKAQPCKKGFNSNNNPPVKWAVFRLPYKGLVLHMPLKGHVKRPTTAL